MFILLSCENFYKCLAAFAGFGYVLAYDGSTTDPTAVSDLSASTFAGWSSTSPGNDWAPDRVKLCEDYVRKLSGICCRSPYKVWWPEMVEEAFELVKFEIETHRTPIDGTIQCCSDVCRRRNLELWDCSYLYFAVRLVHVKFVDDLLEKGANVSATCHDYESPLLAVHWHDIVSRLPDTYAIVKSLARAGANPDTPNGKTGDTILHRAVRDAVVRDKYSLLYTYSPLFNKSFDVISTLLENGASPNMHNLVGDTPLHLAICLVSEEYCNGNHIVVKLLLDHGADVLRRNNLGLTSLHIAATNCDLRSMRLLIESGADANSLLPKNKTPINLFSCRGESLRKLLQNYPSYSTGGTIQDPYDPYYFRIKTKSLDLFRARYWFTKFYLDGVNLLVEHGADPNGKNNYGDIPLILATLEGDVPVVELLVGHGAILDTTHGIHSWTPLFLAACTKNNVLARILLKSGADANARLHGEFEGTTVLHLNAVGEDMMRMFLEAGADPNARQADGSTPLHVAMEVFKPVIVRLLLEHGANPNALTNDGWTPLLMAVRDDTEYTRKEEIAKILLDHGAHPDIAIDGQTALLIAAKNCNQDMVQVLLDNGADRNFSLPDGTTVFHLSLCMREIAKRLLDEGFDIETKKNDGKTLLLIAAQKCKLGIVQLLLDYGADWNFTLPDGTTFFHLSLCMRGISKRLLDEGVDINVKKKDGTTPLHIMLSKYEPRIEQVEYFLSRGANPHAKNNNGSTPYSLLPLIATAIPTRGCYLLNILKKYGVGIEELRNITLLELSLDRDEKLTCARRRDRYIG